MSNKVILALHGGAGMIDPNKQKPAAVNDRLQALKRVLQSVYKSFQQKMTAVDLVHQAVQQLEDYEGFNAGRGSVLTRDGTVEMDAAIMDGETSKAGSVACVKQIKNPINGAKAVMENTHHVMLVDVGAEALCERHKIPLVSNSYFITEQRQEQWLRLKDSGDYEPCIDTNALGTVGAVALDSKNNLAAATSTGGRLNKLIGRVGDSPIIGAGTFASNETCAISGTGHGDIFIRCAVAHDIHALMLYNKDTLEVACNKALAKVATLGGVGGVIALDNKGQVVLPFNTTAMYRGFITEYGDIKVSLYDE